MSISIHIPFYNPNPEKKEGHRNLRRFDYLKENIENLKTLSINCLLYTSPSPRDISGSRMPSSA